MRRTRDALWMMDTNLTELLGQLEIWRSHLDRLDVVSMRKGIPDQSDKDILRSYRGEEQESVPGWENITRGRLRSMVFDTKLLYHLMYIHLCADVSSIQLAAAKGTLPGRDDSDAALHQWAASPQGRRAFLHVTDVMRMFRSLWIQLPPRKAPYDALVYIALAASANVLWAFLAYGPETCTCAIAFGQLDVSHESPDFNDNIAREAWVANGGPVRLQELNFCKCSADTWMRRLAAAVPGRSWPMASIVASMLKPAV